MPALGMQIDPIWCRHQTGLSGKPCFVLYKDMNKDKDLKPSAETRQPSRLITGRLSGSPRLSGIPHQGAPAYTKGRNQGLVKDDSVTGFEKKCQIWGWGLFIVSAVFFMAAAVQAGDWMGFFGALFFLVACFVFLVPVLRR